MYVKSNFSSFPVTIITLETLSGLALTGYINAVSMIKNVIKKSSQIE